MLTHRVHSRAKERSKQGLECHWRLLGVLGFVAWLSCGAVTAHADTFAYITNNMDGTVSVLDTGTLQVVATIRLGLPSPYGVAVDPRGTPVYVTHNINRGGAVSAINPMTNTVVPLSVAGLLTTVGAAVHPSGRFLYVTHYGLSGSGGLVVIDTVTQAWIAQIVQDRSACPSPSGQAPWGVAVRPVGTQVYFTNFGLGCLSVVDTSNNTLAASVILGGCPKKNQQVL